jgi:hypothetical protein
VGKKMIPTHCNGSNPQHEWSNIPPQNHPSLALLPITVFLHQSIIAEVTTSS